MRHLTTTLCLTLAVLLGSAGESFALPECPGSPTKKVAESHDCEISGKSVSGSIYDLIISSHGSHMASFHNNKLEALVQPDGPTFTNAAEPYNSAQLEYLFNGVEVAEKKTNKTKAAPSNLKGPTLPPAEYKPLPEGTKVKYDNWAFEVKEIKDDKFNFVIKDTKTGDWYRFYGIFEFEGSGAHLTGTAGGWNLDSSTELDENSKSLLKKLWSLEVGKKVSYVYEETALDGKSSRKNKVSIEITGTELLQLKGFQYPTYVIKEKSSAPDFNIWLSGGRAGLIQTVSGFEFIQTYWYHPGSGLILKSTREWIKKPEIGTIRTGDYSLVSVQFPEGTTTHVLKGTDELPVAEAAPPKVDAKPAKADQALLAQKEKLKREAKESRKALEARKAKEVKEAELKKKKTEDDGRQAAELKSKKEAEEKRRLAALEKKKQEATRRKAEEEKRGQSGDPSLEKRMATLKRLKDMGLITEKQFKVKQEVVLNEFLGVGGASTATLTTAPAKPSKPSKYADVKFGKYYALVIGNNNYKYLPKLKTAAKDAKAVAAILKDTFGFEVKTLINATRSQILDAFDDYEGILGKSDNLLLYYAGHGWLDKGREQGYWLPVNAKTSRRSQWISNATITDTLKALRAKHVMVVADSCFSGTLTRGLKVTKRIDDYVRYVVGKKARIALTSGGLEPVEDGGGGKNSPFATAFLKVLNGAGEVLTGTDLFKRVKRPVQVNADQTPNYADIRKAGHDGGDFLFVRKR